MSDPLGFVVERSERYFFASADQSARDEPIGQHRILWQQRPMQVAPDSILVNHTLGAVAAVVAMPNLDAAQRLSVIAKVGQSAVVFEADELSPLAFDYNVADEALMSGFGDDVKET